MTLKPLFALTAIFVPAALVAQVPALTLPPSLNLEQETAVRCSAAFAIVSTEQARGSALTARWPTLGSRGREFFVRTGARLMDETGATRPQVQTLFADAARNLRAEPATLGARLESLRQPCLSLLDLTLPPG